MAFGSRLSHIGIVTVALVLLAGCAGGSGPDARFSGGYAGVSGAAG